jgi:hypothetical protein
MKNELGKQIETLRKERGVSTYQLEQRGINSHLSGTIEKGLKGYTIDSLIKYLEAIDKKLILRVEEKKDKKHMIDSYYAGTAQFDNAAPIVRPKEPKVYINEKYGKMTDEIKRLKKELKEWKSQKVKERFERVNSQLHIVTINELQDKIKRLKRGDDI